MMKDKAKGLKPPPFRVRQAISQFIGQPISSDFLPENIMAAQMSFNGGQQKQGQGQQGEGKPKKSTSALSKVSNQYMLSTESATVRQQKS